MSAYSEDLRDDSPRLGSLGMEGLTLLGVREVLNLEDFEFPILLDERKDEDSIVVDCGAVTGVPHGRHLRRSDVLEPETTWQLCEEGQTWRTTLPGASMIS